MVTKYLKIYYEFIAKLKTMNIYKKQLTSKIGNFMVRSLVVDQPRENSCVLQISEEVILNFTKHENL